MDTIVNLFASGMIPLLLTVVAGFVGFSRKDLFSDFAEGVSDGIRLAFSLMPNLILLLCAVSMFRAGGGFDILCRLLAPLVSRLPIPEEMLPVIIMRPLSGSGATAVLRDLFTTSGPDSTAGMAASVLLGSSDAIVYTLSVYFSKTSIKKTRYALPASLVVFLFCVLISCFSVSLFC